MPCACDDCQPDNPAHTYSWAYMQECFERYLDSRATEIAMMRSTSERQAVLAGTDKKMRELLEPRIREIWNRKKGRG